MNNILTTNNKKKINNRFDLILIAANRARNIQIGLQQPLIENQYDKCTIVALKEIKKGLIDNII